MDTKIIEDKEYQIFETLDDLSRVPHEKLDDLLKALKMSIEAIQAARAGFGDHLTLPCLCICDDGCNDLKMEIVDGDTVHVIESKGYE